MRALCHELGEPQDTLRTVHVAGTDGKTSTVRIIASLLDALGVACGETTSPHLEDVTERIRIGGRAVPRAALLGYLPGLEAAIERAEADVGERITFFESITGMALRVFADRAVDAAVVEAGIGGTGDASNVVHADVRVLTRVGLDHAELGATLSEVATEKAGIVESGGTLIVGAQTAEAWRAIERVIADRGATLLRAGHDFGVLTRRPAPGGQAVGLRGLRGSSVRGRLPLPGAHQAANAAVALAAVQCFLGTTDLDPARLRAGLAAVRVPGRIEVTRRDGTPPVVLDGAHDRLAVRALTTTLRESLRPRTATVVLGLSGGRDPRPLLEELAVLEPRFVVTRSASPTAMPAQELAGQVRRWGAQATVAEEPADALEAAAAMTPPGGLVVVTGSLHLVGDARRALGTAALRPPATVAGARDGR